MLVRDTTTNKRRIPAMKKVVSLVLCLAVLLAVMVLQ